MINGVKIEVCCGSIDDVITAEECKGDRIELNSALELGGLTPSLSTLRAAKKITSIPLICMVRSRTAGFCYSETEYEVMKDDAKLLLENGADGIVFGFLNEDGTVSQNRTREFVDIAHSYNKEAVFHKAFDSTINKEDAVKVLINCGIDRILTSGGAVYPDIEEGLMVIKDLSSRYPEIQFLPGGGVRKENARHILEVTGCKQIHMTAKEMAVDVSTLHGDRNNNSGGEYVKVSKKNLLAIMQEIGK